MANIGSLTAHLGVDTTGLRSAGQDFARFEAQTSAGLSSMTKSVVALAAAFGSLKLVQAGSDAVMFAASVQQADVALKSIANSMGMSSKAAISARDSLRDLNITTMSSTNATAQFIRLGLPVDSLNKLGVAAQGAAINYKMMTGETISSSEALDKMTHAIATQQVMVLHNLGLNVTMRDILRANKIETGESATAIGHHERQLKLLNEVLKQSEPLMKLYGDSTGLAAKNISSSKRPVEELKLALGNLFLPELTAASLAFYRTVSGGQKWIRSHTDELNTAAGVIADFSQGLLYATGIVGGYVAVMGTAVIINNGFAASFGIFTSLFVAMQAQLSLTGAAATITSTQFNAMGVSVATSAQVATVGVLSLKAAMTVLSGFMIGWEIGKWWASFESGAKTGVYIVHALIKAWDWVAEAAERAWVVMKGSATTWTGVMDALDKIGKKYEAIAKTRSAALAGGLDAAGKPMAAAAGGAYKESPAEVAANAARIAAQRAKEEADQAKAAGAKLAEQWADTKRTLEGEMNLSALTGLDKALQEITNKAKEYRIQFGEKPEIAAWEAATKAVARQADEMERLTKQMDELGRVQEGYDAVVMDSLPKEQEAAARLNEEYRKKQYIIQDAVKQELISSEEAARISRNLSIRQQKDLEELANKGSATAKIFEEVAKSIHTSFVDFFENIFDKGIGSMRKLGDGILTIFKKIFAQMAVLAIARPIIVPVVTALGSGMGVPASAMAGTMQQMGVDSSGLSTASTGFSLASAWNAGTVSGGLQHMASGALNSASMFANNLGMDAVGSIASDAGLWLEGLSGGLADGLTAGVASLAMSLLTGERLTVQTGLQAGGAVLGGAIGGPIGAVLGGLVGNFIGGLFGGGGENEFTLTELVPSMTTSFDKATGMAPSNWKHPAGGNAWYAPIANAYSDTIGQLQTNFNAQVFQLTDKLPQEMQTQILDTLAATNFTKMLSEAVGGRWGASGAQGAIEGVAKNFATALAGALGNAYASALSNYITTQGAAGLIGDSAVWSVLTERVQNNINDLFSGAASTIKGGDIEGGLTAINNVGAVIAQISSALAPITEILETADLSDYEKELRGINIQFDQYASALEAAGVDLAKYTDLEKARGAVLAEAAKAQQDTLKAQQEALKTTSIADLIENMSPFVDGLVSMREAALVAGDAMNDAYTSKDWDAYAVEQKKYLDAVHFMRVSASDLKNALALVPGALDPNHSLVTAVEAILADISAVEELRDTVTTGSGFTAAQREATVASIDETLGFLADSLNSTVKSIAAPVTNILNQFERTDLQRAMDDLQTWYDQQVSLYESLAGVVDTTSMFEDLNAAAEYQAQQLISNYIDPITGAWEDFFSGMTTSSLAPVQSLEAFEAQLEKLIAGATDLAGTQKLQSFITGEYLPFMQAAAPDYKEVFNDLISSSSSPLNNIKVDLGAVQIDSAAIGEAIAAAIGEAWNGQEINVVINIDGKEIKTSLLNLVSSDPDYAALTGA